MKKKLSVQLAVEFAAKLSKSKTMSLRQRLESNKTSLMSVSLILGLSLRQMLLNKHIKKLMTRVTLKECLRLKRT